MFVRNKSGLPVVLRRGALTEEINAGAIIVEQVLRLEGARLVPAEPAPRAPTEPPDTSAAALFRGVSVTAAGTVLGPRSAPFIRALTFQIGAESRRLLVSGDRSWKPNFLGDLVATPPAPFEALALTFDRSFGGSYVVPPGVDPASELPSPGGKVAYPLNERGVGFHPSKEAAVGAPLPNFELADQAVQKWSDRPEPGCFVPCPDLVALRIAHTPPPPDSTTSSPPEHYDEMVPRLLLRIQHHAPGYLIFDELAAGTPIQLQGMDKETLRFELPGPPVRVELRREKTRTEVGARLRSVHLDADRRLVRCAYGYEFRYIEAEAPSFIRVEALPSRAPGAPPAAEAPNPKPSV